MNGPRSPDNFNLWNAPFIIPSNACLVSREDIIDLWRMRLGHLNLRGLAKIVSKEAVCGLPALKIKEGKICGECQVGKHSRASHKNVDHLTTSRVIELFHMDIMGPM